MFLENYILESVEYDCFNDIPMARIHTSDAGVREIKFKSSDLCHNYLEIQSKVFYECHDESGLNRFEVNEKGLKVSHSFKLESQNNCSDQKLIYINKHFKSLGVQ